jgi:hypothetical protein
MSQTPPSPPANRLAAIKEDGFVDFYELLGVEPDATVTRLRTTVNAIYNEAQSNRDHRNLNRRREYQTLLQLLPQARELLLDEGKRKRYDEFREEVQRGITSTSFEDWARNLKEEEEEADAEQSVVLGVQDEARAGAVVATAKVQPARPAAPSRVTVGSEPVAPNRRSLTGTVIAVAVFLVLFILLFLVLKLGLPIAIIISGVASVVTWFITHRKGQTTTAV